MTTQEINWHFVAEELPPNEVGGMFPSGITLENRREIIIDYACQESPRQWTAYFDQRVMEWCDCMGFEVDFASVTRWAEFID